ncbi:hypothetical protein JW897_19375 [Chromobacterium alkanivorans]|uniref:cytotoxic necrotizing factor Rho-activating domain-containing protein n=1 Tax=Chromobacterium alkanivorans TaxID=1071719 RepID=UPI0019680CB1|nr:cytotoxic necrotizing factor Rho-activating domain-containing protein [Chromobacterium alkanivorans]MBN3005902.1 hypothetical protein [Chromobacterium alkanivorans]
MKISSPISIQSIYSQLRQHQAQHPDKSQEPSFGLSKNGALVVYNSRLHGLLHPNQTKRAKAFVRHLCQDPTAQANLRGARKALISQSHVVHDRAQYGDPTANFRLDARQNKIVTTSSPQEKLLFERDKAQVLSGSVAPLIGKGVLASAAGVQTAAPAGVVDCIRYDRDGEKKGGDAVSADFIKFYHGDQAKAEELIPGTPIGNHYNKFQFGDALRLIEIGNGLQGTVGMKFDTGKMQDGDCCLFSAGALSGCTMVYALKGGMLYAYHAGTVKNGDDEWETASDGARSIVDAHRQLSGEKTALDSPVGNNRELAAFLREHFDHAMMVYSGKGTTPDLADSGHVRHFDYNKTPLRQELASVGNALALLKKTGDSLSIEFLGDSMRINHNCGVHSQDSAIYAVDISPL